MQVQAAPGVHTCRMWCRELSGSSPLSSAALIPKASRNSLARMPDSALLAKISTCPSNGGKSKVALDESGWPAGQVLLAKTSTCDTHARIIDRPSKAAAMSPVGSGCQRTTSPCRQAAIQSPPTPPMTLQPPAQVQVALHQHPPLHPPAPTAPTHLPLHPTPHLLGHQVVLE